MTGKKAAELTTMLTAMALIASGKPSYTNKEPRIYKGKSSPKKKHKIKIAKRSRRINRRK